MSACLVTIRNGSNPGVWAIANGSLPRSHAQGADPLDEGRGDGTGADGVDADAVAGVVDGGGAGVVHHRAFGGVIGREAVVAGEPGDRGGVDDRAASALAHDRDGRLAAVEDA